jgi:predicted nucleic-acid-binding Zn-ribbon protein
MKCPKCNGSGFRVNKSYPNPASWSFAGVPGWPCKHCGESGYIIGNIKDVLDFLKHLEVKFGVEHNKEYVKMVKQCIDSIEK